ncbi:MAG: DUF4340 domain-containing protein [Candidatus Adiutricales bacterium]
MKPRQLIIDPVIFILVGGFYFIYDVYIRGEETKLEEAEAKILDIDASEVTALRLVTPKNDMQFELREDDEWYMTKPVQTPAVSHRVKSIVDRILEGKKEEIFPEPVDDLSGFGLDKPQIAVTMMNGSKILGPTFFLGAKKPIGSSYYARLGQDRRIFTISSFIQGHVNRSFRDLRNRDLILAAPYQIDGLKFLGPVKMELKKDDNGKWEFIHPKGVAADKTKVNKVITQGLKGRIEEFITSDKEDKKYGFDTPSNKLIVLSQGKTVAEVTIGKAREAKEEGSGGARTKGYWAMTNNRPEVLFIDSITFDELNKTPDDLRDKHLFSFVLRAVNFMEIRGPKTTVKASKEGEAWLVTEPEKSPTGGREVTNFLYGLAELEYVRLLETSGGKKEEIKFDQDESITVILKSADKVLNEFTMSTRADEEDFLNIRTESGVAALVDADFLARVPPEFRTIEYPPDYEQ